MAAAVETVVVSAAAGTRRLDAKAAAVAEAAAIETAVMGAAADTGTAADASNACRLHEG
jgi:hypothetical protein